MAKKPGILFRIEVRAGDATTLIGARATDLVGLIPLTDKGETLEGVIVLKLSAAQVKASRGQKAQVTFGRFLGMTDLKFEVPVPE